MNACLNNALLTNAEPLLGKVSIDEHEEAV